MKIKRGVALVMALLLSGAASLGAQEESGIAVDTVDVAVLENWPPYYMLDSVGAPTGFAVETLEAVLRRSNLAPRYSVHRTFPEALAALAAGDVDLIPDLGIVEGRAVRYTMPLGAFSVGFFTRESTPGRPGPEDVSGSIGAVDANIGPSLLASSDIPASVVVYGSIREALFRLIAGEVDGLIYPTPVVWALARQAGVDGRIKETRSELVEVRRAIGVAMDREDLVGRLDAAIAPFIVSEEYARLQEEWFSPRPPYWNTRRVVGLGLSLAAIILLALAAWHSAARERMNREIRHRERKLRDLFDSIRDAIVVTDTDRRIVDMNPAALELFGYGLEEIRGKETEVLYADQSDFETMGRQLREDADQDGHLLGVRFRTRDGEEFIGETSAFYQRNEHGEPVAFVGLIRDVTQRLEEERTAATLRRQLARAQRMESVGRLAGGIAHDFNNVLTVVQGNIELALQSLDPGDPVRDELAQAQAAAARSAQLTQQLLGFARRQTTHPRILDANETIEGMIGMLHRLVTEEIELTCEPAEDTWPVRIDPGQVDQILANLVVNARDAIDGAGRIVIRTRKMHLDAEAAADIPDAEPGHYTEISVTDDGSGIPEEILSDVFEPFFTTKPEGRGTGLGLATTYGIVKQNGGFIAIDSEVGRGTTVKICLPRHTGREQPSPEQPTEPPGKSTGERILLVEDDAAVLAVTIRILDRLGYETVGLQEPEKALQLVENGHPSFDMLITDVVMPRMNGRELAAHIRESIPGLPILFVSGYSHDVIGQPGDEMADRHLLRKPFTPKELGQKVREILDG